VEITPEAPSFVELHCDASADGDGLAHAPRGTRAGPGRATHLVQFYDEDGFLYDTVTRFLGAGLAGGEGVIVIATAAHVRGIQHRLAQNAFDPERARATGQLVLLDAHQTLAEIMVGGSIDRERLIATLTPVLDRSVRGRKGGIRAYGEMVDILCRRNQHDLAVELEQRWNELLAERPITLLCTYALTSFASSDQRASFRGVCAAHTHVRPGESFAALDHEDARLREVSLLQQRALALESEIEQRKATERALREREHELSEFLDNAAEGIHSVGPDGTILWANRAELQLLGYTAEEYIGRNVAEFHVDGEVIEGILARLTSGENLQGVEARLRSKDGSIRHVLISSNVYRREAQFVHTRCFTRDITERKRAENESRRAAQKLEALVQELETASRMKDEFLATVSHELRTPLNAILGWTHMLRSGAISVENAERALEIIERNARAQTQLIGDLLDVSRIISGKMRLAIAPVDVAQLVRAAVDAVLPAARAKGVAIAQAIDPAVGTIAGDADRLQQVLWNLLSNAVKFTPKGGRVQLRVERREAVVEVVVSDDGQGIEPAFLSHIFERFRQADSSASRKHAGLGLGLAIVRHLVELHGGWVKVESEGRNKGSKFVASFPTSPLHAAGGEPPGAARRSVAPRDFACPPELEGVHILVVEDDDDARELLVHVLERCKARVSAASNVPEALETLDRAPPDVIVSDIGLPGEDGYAFIKQVRTRPPERGGRAPAIALTAYARVEDRTKALLAGFNTHVPKPIEPVELIAMLSSLSALFPKD
jgi:PAS domain S-box-containing protein